MTNQQSANRLITAARAELGDGIDAYLLGWLASAVGPDEVAEAIEAYRASHVSAPIHSSL